MKKRHTLFYNFIVCLARIVFPKAETVYEEAPDPEPGVFVCNHSKIRGPAMMILDFKRPFRSWIISAAMEKRTVRSYAFHDVFNGDGRHAKWFWKLLSCIVGFLLPPLLKDADMIPVYRDKRMLLTFRQSSDALKDGESMVIFAESPQVYSDYINKLQPGFVTLGAVHHRQTGKKLKFYPVYCEKKNRKIAVGKPIEYDPSLPLDKASAAVCAHLEEGIDRMARSLKPHKPVRFLTKLWYSTYGQQYTDNPAAYWEMVENDSRFVRK